VFLEKNKGAFIFFLDLSQSHRYFQTKGTFLINQVFKHSLNGEPNPAVPVWRQGLGDEALRAFQA
jgi:hypothetical protein